MTFFDKAVICGLGQTEDKSRVTALLHYTSSSTVVNINPLKNIKNTPLEKVGF
jgi:biotin synthase-like enzyme